VRTSCLTARSCDPPLLRASRHTRTQVPADGRLLILAQDLRQRLLDFHPVFRATAAVQPENEVDLVAQACRGVLVHFGFVRQALDGEMGRPRAQARPFPIRPLPH
jgi:hypothetical protein